MNQDQVQAVQQAARFSREDFTLFGSQFTRNYEDRTLVYGYDCDRNTVHVYLRDQVVHKVVYSGLTIPQEAQTVFNDPQDLVPNKRLYAETCDYDFCLFLAKKHVNMAFTKPNDARKVEKFYGLTA